MIRSDKLTARNFPSAQEEAAQQAASFEADFDANPPSAYRLAFTDTDFLVRPELRPVRMQLELLKPELVQQELNIQSTVVIFGSARIADREAAQAAVDAARAANDSEALLRAERRLLMSGYYEEARRFARLITEHTKDHAHPLYVVTGGGPGIMEAGNRGAHDAGGRSIGLNIVLPHEQRPNQYITPELCFRFHYFGLRKMHFLIRSVALAAFPGGYGTLDELFETLTLIQTGKCRRRPILLFGRDFWSRLIDFDLLLDTGMISPGDEQLFHYVETADEAWALLMKEYDIGSAVPAGNGSGNGTP
ncbi:MAG: LOG family protein [Mitsuaria chitosanitabida]|uniref:LOG family protein n=1 Tax=Roseateles chitosanitabidus TaxID=65048 RepID=UPI001B2A83FB|nr:LOG family protein [Roseateles chitosanitabidus]MBO9688764.1 LOG family protein [Roseateles chitosanitabidus]